MELFFLAKRVLWPQTSFPRQRLDLAEKLITLTSVIPARTGVRKGKNIMKTEGKSRLKRVLWQGFICMILLSAFAYAEQIFIVPETFYAWNTNSECRLSGKTKHCDVWDKIETGAKMVILRKLYLDPDYLHTTTLFQSREVYEVAPGVRKNNSSFYIPAEYVDEHRGR